MAAEISCLQRGFWLAFAAGAVLIGPNLAAAQSDEKPQAKTISFRWLDAKKDPRTYQQVGRAFKEELQPDEPEKVKPYSPIAHKYVHRIGSFQSSLLVLIGYRDSTDPKNSSGDFFRGFNYNP